MLEPRARAARSWSTAAIAALGCGLLAILAIGFARAGGTAPPIWPINTLLIAFLLRRGGRLVDQVPVLAGVYLILALANTVGRSPLVLVLAFPALNVAEIVLSVILARRFAPLQFRTVGEGWRFLFVVGPGPILLGALGAGWIALLAHRPDPVSTAVTWASAEFLGFVTIGPPAMTISRAEIARLDLRQRWLEALAGAALMLAVASVVFLQNTYPLSFLLAPFVMVATFRFRLLGAYAAVLLCALVAIPATLTGHGPSSLVKTDAPAARILLLQMVLALNGLTAVPIAAALTQYDRLIGRLRRHEAALAESERRYRLLAENSPDIITQSDLDGVFRFVSPAVREVTGYTPEEAVGRPALDFVHPDDRAMVRARIAASLAIPEGRPIQHRHIRKDGRVIWIESRPRLLRDPDTGAPAAVIDALRDITTRKALEGEIVAAHAEAEAAASAKAEFLSNMSHEIRTPLTSIIGFAGILSKDPSLSARALGLVERIQRAGDALLTLVNDILDFSKLEARQLELHPQPTPVRPFLQDCLSFFEPQARTRNLAIRFDDLGGLDAQASIDRDRLRQVLLNLIGNAVKFTEAGSVTLSAQFAAGRLECRVIDTGKGVPTERASRLFQRFSQIDGSATRSHGGTGLGLAICKGLIEAMGGEIGYGPAEGQGSVFWFNIPCREGDAGAAGETAPGLSGAA